MFFFFKHADIELKKENGKSAWQLAEDSKDEILLVKNINRYIEMKIVLIVFYYSVFFDKVEFHSERKTIFRSNSKFRKRIKRNEKEIVQLFIVYYLFIVYFKTIFC